MSEPRTIAGRYVLEAPIGRGLLGTLYRGHATGGHGYTRLVAIEQLEGAANDPRFADALAKRASALMGASHVHVEDVLDVVTEGKERFVVLEWCDGPALRTWIEAHHQRGVPAPHGPLLAIAAKVLFTLHALHTRPVPIVHGLVGASSIRLDRAGQPLLTRACIASALDAAGIDLGLAHPAPGGRGTPAADVFCTGLMVYTALAGATEAKFLPEDLRARVLAGKPVDLNLIRDDLPPVLLRTIERALLPDPRARFDSAAQMARALELILRSLPENTDPAALAHALDELVPETAETPKEKAGAKEMPSAPDKPSAPPATKVRTSGAPPPVPEKRAAEPKLGVRAQGTDQLDLDQLEALRIGDERE